MATITTLSFNGRACLLTFQVTLHFAEAHAIVLSLCSTPTRDKPETNELAKALPRIPLNTSTLPQY
jgi:hypothetical protein